MRKLSAALLIVFLTSSAPAFSTSDGNKSVNQKIKDRKHLLVDQIIDAVQADNNLSDDEIAKFEKKQQERVDRMIDVIADKAKMSAEEKAKLKEKIAETKEQHNSIPPELKEKLVKHFDFKNFSKQTTCQVLTDHFEDSDLKAILRFLKSSTGQKFFREGPDMIGQVLELSAERYVPIIMDLCKEFKLPSGLSPMDNNREHRREMMEKLRQLFKDRLPPQSPTGPGRDET
jgi:hypothetical protein